MTPADRKADRLAAERAEKERNLEIARDFRRRMDEAYREAEFPEDKPKRRRRTPCATSSTP